MEKIRCLLQISIIQRMVFYHHPSRPSSDMHTYASNAMIFGLPVPTQGNLPVA